MICGVKNVGKKQGVTMTDFTQRFLPNTIEAFAGQQQRNIATSLKNSVDTGNIQQKILFIGSSGIGKTSLSRFYADLLDAQVEHVNCIHNSGVDFVRGLIDGFHLPSLTHSYRVYLLDEIHGLSNTAQEALLVPLENLPAHVIILATSTEPQKLKGTLKSRFKVERLSLPSTEELKDLMKRIFRDINIKVSNDVKERTVQGDTILVTPDYARDLLGNSEGNIRTLVTLIEAAVDGTFESFTDKALNDTTLGEIWHDIVVGRNRFDYNIADFGGIARGLGYYALAVLRGDNKNVAPVAAKVLQNFGQGLSVTMPPEIAFYSVLLDVVG